jgi:cell wall-associated NlpC family hydrolase
VRQVCIALSLLFGSASAVIAQAPASVGAYRDQAISLRSAAGGFGGELGFGDALALRLSGGIWREADDEPGWRGDLTLALSPLSLHTSLRNASPMGASPYVVMGAGLIDSENTFGAYPSASLSLGAGLSVPVLTPALSVFGEARNRTVLGREDDGRWEGRGGIRLAVRRPSAGREARTSRNGSLRPRAAALELTREANRHIGVPYRWGGNTPDSGFDCSGFVRYVYAALGTDLPRVTRDQAQVGRALPLDLRQLVPGDLVFFASDRRTIDHVGIYLGNERMIHAPSTGSHVRIDYITGAAGRWYEDRLVAARRILD